MLIVVAVGAVLVLGGRQLAPLVPAFANWMEGLGWAGPLLFMLVYAVACLLLLPASVFTMIAGAVYGVGWGTLYTAVGALVAMASAFLISRHLVRNTVARCLASRPELAAIDRAVELDGFRIVLLLRLSPIFPFSILNYALGLTRVRYRDYLLASVGSIPGTFVFVSAGRLAGDLATVAAGEASPDSQSRMMLLGIGLVATVTVLTIVTRLARKALAEATGVGRP
ncbi:MAG TPA: TVP38/TMEM64 family protein [Gemmatimonadales bacterium]|nr:TVP38/TMEM64 family protein [Gemmatimonadales bacterium]